MEIIIQIDGQAVSVEVTVEVYEYLDRADHKEENLAHEQRRYWDGREFDEYLALFHAAARYLENLESTGEAITPKIWQAEVDKLTAQRTVQYQQMMAMREQIKAVENLKKTAEQLSRTKPIKKQEREI